jgi:hypothetical protein
MSISKQVKDHLIKFLLAGDAIPVELFELAQYFRENQPIEFDIKEEAGEVIAISKNFRFGIIVTSAHSMGELDDKIKDAILTSFDVPSSYANEAGLRRVGELRSTVYAFA